MPESEPIRPKLLAAITAHVALDGWTDAAFGAACTAAGVSPDLARAICPHGAADLAADYHRQGDAVMRQALAEADLSEMKTRDRVAHAVRLRIEAADKEVVRRSAAFFALPVHSAEGARLIWGTADAIWTALGDHARDANWYTKRAILSGVFASTVLYWLGDDSEDQAESWAFLDRRVEDVMRLGKIRAGVERAPGLAMLIGRLSAIIRAPHTADMQDMQDAPGTGQRDQ